MAVAVYPGSDLVENIFASNPNDFKTHGIYTCRFYVEGEWVEVITDTKIPCVRDQITGAYLPVYSRSTRDNELWLPFIQKAYAKAVGNYESIQKTKVSEALLQLTGGSVQQAYLTNEQGEDMPAAWATLMAHSTNDTIILALPSDSRDHENADSGGNGDEAEEKEMEDINIDDQEDPDQHRGLLPNKLYSVVACKEIGGFGNPSSTK